MCEGMNLVQIRHTRSFKAYVHNSNAQMIVTPKMDEIAKNAFPEECCKSG
jgi:hypothetical protein